MTIFLDTSAFLAIVDAGDVHHAEADQQWSGLLDGVHDLVCTDCILVETLALLQNRHGMDAVKDFNDTVIPILRIVHTEKEVFDSAMTAFIIASNRNLSFVDCVSFSTMRKYRIVSVFTFDKHFRQQGFTVFP
jgi:predicted nucleic acid-binding protein